MTYQNLIENATIKASLDEYTNLFPDEKKDLENLYEQLENDADVISRKNFVGHVTASVFVIQQDTKKILLLDHKSLKIPLQPGGHVDPDDISLYRSALRELSEETGLVEEQLTVHWISKPGIPFDIDVHRIPERPQKNEASHWHYDFRYLVTTNEVEINVNLEEAGGYKWVTFDQLKEIRYFDRVANREKHYFDRVVNKIETIL